MREHARVANLASPASTGGSGHSFEAAVAACYLAGMLARAAPVGMEGVSRTTEVQFQTRWKGAVLDDLCVTAKSDTGKPRRAFIQVKRTMRFTKSDRAFREFITAAWQHFARRACGFNPAEDILVSAVGAELPRHDDFRTLKGIADGCRSGVELAAKIRRRGFASDGQRAIYQLLCDLIAEARGDRPDDDEVWGFLTCLVIWYFEIGDNYERSTALLSRELLRSVLTPPTPGEALKLFGQLCTLSSRMAARAGTVDRAKLCRHVRRDGFRLGEDESHTEVTIAADYLWGKARMPGEDEIHPELASLRGIERVRRDHVAATSLLLASRDYAGVLANVAKVLQDGKVATATADLVVVHTLEAAARRALDEHVSALRAMEKARAIEVAEDRLSASTAANTILCLRDAGEAKRAQMEVGEAISRWPDDAPIWLAAATVAADGGDLDAAHERVEKAKQLDPTWPAPWHVSASLAARVGNYSRALAECRKAYELSNGDPDPAIHNQMGVLLLRVTESQGGVDAAALKDALDQLIRADRVTTGIGHTKLGRGVKLNLAIARLLNDQPDEATAILNGLASTGDMSSVAWACLGECHLRSSDWKQAVAAYEQAIAMGETDSAVRNNLAVAMMRLDTRNVRSALRNFAAIVEGHEPAEAAAAANMAQCFLRLDQPGKALAVLDKASELGATDWRMTHLRAQALNQTGQTEGAVSAAISAVHAAPLIAEPHRFLWQLFNTHLLSRLRDTLARLKEQLPWLAADPRPCDEFLDRAVTCLSIYGESLQNIPPPPQSEKVGSELPWRPCAECWEIELQLRRCLDPLERDVINTPMMRRRRSDHIRRLLTGAHITASPLLEGRGDLASRGALVMSVTDRRSPDTQLTIQVEPSPETTPASLGAVVADDASLLVWPGGTYLRLIAARAEIGRGWEGLSALESSAVEPYDHQVRAVLHVLRNCDGQAVLADEVGLGKTIEAGLIAKEYMARGMVRTVLVLVPPALMRQWLQEMKQRFGLDFAEWSQAWSDEQWQGQPLVIASMYALRRPEHVPIVDSREWDLLIVDEAHHARRPGAQLWRLVARLRATRRLLLTATPIHNSMRDLYTLCNLARPGVFGSYAAFSREFVDASDPAGRTPRNVPGLRRLLSNVLIRTRRAETVLDLPPRRVTTVAVALTEEERNLYDNVTEYIRTRPRRLASGQPDLVRYVIQRELCSSPEAAAHTLLSEAATSRAERRTRERLSDLVDACHSTQRRAKHEALATILNNRPGEKFVIYSEFRRTAEVVAAFLAGKGWRVALLHGGHEREGPLRDFAGGADVLVTTVVGSEGLNLQFCWNVVNFDFPWNPMRIEQRIGRVHRIGQKRDVHVWNLVAAETIEEYVVEVLERKLHMFELVVGEAATVIQMVREQLDFEARVQAIMDNARNDLEEKRMFAAFGEQIADTVARANAWRWQVDIMPLSNGNGTPLRALWACL